MLRGDAVGCSMRAAERILLKDTDLVLVSSPGFSREYFADAQPDGPPVHLVENRVVTRGLADTVASPVRPAARADDRIVLGWFGILRCRASLVCLDAVTRRRPGRFRIMMRGRPALDEIPDVHARVAANPDFDFGGSYAYPDDLPRIYGAVDLASLIDRYDAGRNSAWLLPNRFYESGMVGVPPVALSGTEVAREMARLDIGLFVDSIDPGDVARRLAAVTSERLEELRRRQRAVPGSTWQSGPADALRLVARLRGMAEPAAPAPVLPPPEARRHRHDAAHGTGHVGDDLHTGRGGACRAAS